jgi:hypothetical protein
MALGCVTGLDPILYDRDAPLRWLTDFLVTFGFIAIKLPSVIIGANIYYFYKT